MSHRLVHADVVRDLDALFPVLGHALLLLLALLPVLSAALLVGILDASRQNRGDQASTYNLKESNVYSV